MFIEPMYAQPLPNLEKNPRAKPFILGNDEVVAEEKFDGIRLVTEIDSRSDKLFIEKGIKSWSRLGNLQSIPEHIQEELSLFPNCYIDGELLAPGKRSYGTKTIANSGELVYFVFDLLRIEDDDITAAPYSARRNCLRSVFPKDTKHVRLAPAEIVNTWDEVYALRDDVYARDGEGLILKRVTQPYMIGKRPKNTWIKIKKLQSQIFTVTGFEESRGEKNYRGPCGMTKLISPEGVITQVKTKNDALCREAENLMKNHPHPWVGRRLWCEYQELTPYGEYRHIRWDHWDGE